MGAKDTIEGRMGNMGRILEGLPAGTPGGPQQIGLKDYGKYGKK